MSAFSEYFQRNMKMKKEFDENELMNRNFLGMKAEEFKGQWPKFLKFAEMCNCLKANGMSISDAVYIENMGIMDGRYVVIDLGLLF